MSAQPGQGLFPARIIARLLNMTERRLQQLAREGIVPKAARGQYPLAGCVRAYITYLQSQGQVDSSNPDRLSPFQKRAHYQAELDKLKLESERGELIPRIEVEQEMAGLLKVVAETFDTLPDLLERDCGLAPKHLARVETALDRARETLYERLGQDDDAASGAAAEAG
jgi:phage terminase Nu1 subunit (DNA packaging protein)